MKFKNNVHTVTKSDIIYPPRTKYQKSDIRIHSGSIKKEYIGRRGKWCDEYIGAGTIEDRLGYVYGFKYKYRIHTYPLQENRGLDVIPVKTEKSRYKKAPKIKLRFSKGVKNLIKMELKKKFG